MGSATLYFSIHKGAVWGTTTPRCFSHLTAVSGGGGGSTLGNVDNHVVNNPNLTGQVTHGSANSPNHVHGGPLPIHRYRILRPAINPHLGLSAQLIPSGHKPMFDRSDFFFHGRGPHGSDGCIVLTNPNQFRALMNALAASNGGLLHVVR